MADSTNKQIILRNFPTELHKQLKHRAIEENTTLGKLIIHILSTWLLKGEG